MNRCLFAILALSVMSLISASAGAADSKTFPGSFCHPDGETFTSFHSGGGLFNAVGFQVPDDPSDNSDDFYACPIVRDITKAQANGILSARLHVVDSNPSKDFSCTLQSRAKASPTASPSLVEFASDSSSGTGNQQLEFPALDSGAGGYYFFVCRVPALHSNGFSGIWSYAVTEKE